MVWTKVTPAALKNLFFGEMEMISSCLTDKHQPSDSVRLLQLTSVGEKLLKLKSSVFYTTHPTIIWFWVSDISWWNVPTEPNVQTAEFHYLSVLKEAEHNPASDWFQLTYPVWCSGSESKLRWCVLSFLLRCSVETWLFRNIISSLYPIFVLYASKWKYHLSSGKGFWTL